MKIYSPSFLLIFSTIWGASSSATTTPEQHLQNGDQLAQTLLSKISQDQQSAGAHPFYQGVSSESGLSDGGLRGRIESSARGSLAAQMVRESSETRPRFKIDPERDPLLTGAERIMSQPLTIIGGDGTHLVQTTQGGVDETLTCEEPGEDSLHTCISRLQVVVKEELGPAQQGTLDIGGGSYGALSGLLQWPRVCKRHHVAHLSAGQDALRAFVSRQRGIPLDRVISVSASQHGGWNKVAHKAYVFSLYRFVYSFYPLIKVAYSSWDNSACNSLEGSADQAHCGYVSKICTQGPGTRIFEGVPVTKDCWEETYTYSCSHSSKDDCGPLRARGCVQINSACKQRVGAACVVYTQTYQCKGNKTTKDRITGGAPPFCLDGACRDQGFESNDEMMASLAQLSILKELQGQMWNGTLFKGSDNRCSKCTLSFKDCCGSGKGWGVDLGLSGCSADEKALRIKRQKGLCHFVGTYCSKREKITKICLQKKSSYCCFGSKLLKAFHTQGRPQIGMGWGSAEEPLCRGFTIDEIQRIDFSKLDLREVFEDLMKNFKPGKAEGITQKINERLEIMKQGIRPKTEPQVKQRDSA